MGTAAESGAFTSKQLQTLENQIKALHSLTRKVAVSDAALAACQPLYLLPRAGASLRAPAAGGGPLLSAAAAAAGYSHTAACVGDGASLDGAPTTFAAAADGDDDAERPRKKAKTNAPAPGTAAVMTLPPPSAAAAPAQSKVPSAAGDREAAAGLMQQEIKMLKQRALILSRMLKCVDDSKEKAYLQQQYEKEQHKKEEVEAKKQLQEMERLVDEELLCQICFERKRDTLTEPCSHMMFCRSCLDRHWRGVRAADRQCPCCRASVGRMHTSRFTKR